MAKDVNAILAEMDAQQATITELAPLNSVSSTAVYKKFKYLIALAHAAVYQMWDAVKAEINTLTASQIIGTPAWYVNLALTFNSGLNAQRASCREVGTKVILKVAKSAAGVTSQLTNTELSNLTTFVNSKKVAGTDISIVSQTADLVSLVVSIQYSGVQSAVEVAVIAAIKNHLASLPFDATLSRSLIENALISLSDVLDASVDVLSVDYGLGYEIILGNLAAADAGYFEVGKLAGNDLITLNMYQ